MSADDIRIGAHTSIAKSAGPYDGPANAVHQQVDYGGNCGQIFSHSPQVWQSPDVDDEAATQFRDLAEENDVRPWVIHSSYLVNLCTPKDDLRRKSLESMQEEVDVADRLGIPYVNVHLGAHTGAGVEGGLANAGSVLDDLDVPESVTVLIESDAGSGTKLGGQFEHLATVADETSEPIEFCLDTAHVFAAGYDLSTAEGVEATFAEFDDVVGLDRLSYVHLNDSKHACGTNKDEHAHIGEGEIGVEGMRAFINTAADLGVPMALETPTEDGKSFPWNIERVRELHQA
ncbi:deoxyribonuclease IV [Halosegnis rubeus]|jgi:deoxyribonuclease-4|uniref:Probable endonuclease 4 n=1 Tax=Halosegnis rubeus TaxID=2212850 RepID=A0A5N5UDQ1_9EURY|nr:deoxyribonuclease IV [Halosegnis rubeus]KAB7516039.1 deoxyribonuclease IV [Halosegnis rubeus]KAB7516747.1 deoxyribonuclease IV [Halosegnis rubeus]KAB7520122.1 deoxyribonuclease IV [Halosegnis rubeus]